MQMAAAQVTGENLSPIGQVKTQLQVSKQAGAQFACACSRLLQH